MGRTQPPLDRYAAPRSVGIATLVLVIRVDVSTEAGDRFDKNLTGLRFEEEIGFNADPPVLAGAFQRITTIVP